VSWVHSSVEVAELFASLSEPDEFEVQAQLELFAWTNRTKGREQSRQSMANRYRTDEVYRERQKQAVKARQKERYATDPEFRERMKQHARDRYARLKRAA
jgi:hypothetical protein